MANISLTLPRGKFDRLRLILGDQLHAGHSWFRNKDPRCLYLIAELHQEATYTRHHVQKVCAFFAAMEHFAEALEKTGHTVLHLTLDQTKDFKELPQLIRFLAGHYGISNFDYQQPDEYRLLKQLRNMQLPNQIKRTEYESEHFLLPFSEIDDTKTRWNTMEQFYRAMRRRHDILMHGDKPAGDQWNFDKQNREKLNKADLEDIPQPLTFSTRVTDSLQRLDRHKIQTIGRAQEELIWPVTRRQSRQLLRFFCAELLPRFGRFQDAMTCQSEHAWSLYHSRLSFALNSKMLHPKEVIDQAISAYRDNRDIDLAQVEGFIRQILGWREYVRLLYWQNMPDYAGKNFFNAQRKLPGYFWTGQTKMRCMQSAIGQSLDYAYAHHIQRLMITGNFCLLAGIHPDEVDDWYLGIYVDAVEWVEMPNTRGMSQFADGGLLATKPYSASANYINKMSDYCKHCEYDHKAKTGNNACPFNSLYWRFMDKHREVLSRNHRIGMVYRNWDKQGDDAKQAVLDKAQAVLQNIEKL